MAADGYRTKPIREPRLEEAHAAIKVPLNFHADKPAGAVLEGCSANPAQFSPWARNAHGESALLRHFPASR
jgi:hypothetical protein